MAVQLQFTVMAVMVAQVAVLMLQVLVVVKDHLLAAQAWQDKATLEAHQAIKVLVKAVAAVAVAHLVVQLMRRLHLAVLVVLVCYLQ